MFTGLDIQIDFGMYEDEKDTKRKAKQLKKKGGKPLGGRLFKMSQLQPKAEVVKPKDKMKDGDGPYGMGGKGGADHDKKDGDPSGQGKGPEQQKVPRVRRIVGAQVLNENGQSVPMNILNSSNPNDLQA